MRGIAAYKSVRKISASPERLLVMLYERAIQDQEEAISYISDGDLVSALPHLQRCRKIFIELLNALDRDEAPELTENLRQLYLWAIRELISAGRDNSVAPIRRTLRMTKDLHEAWDQVLS